ncbi:hypothetical protein QO010_002832 [Caulobacter ginsengisoli]|uniref:Uncharacterized protein n=1 Tax=Caulobacter ginsengisoli TaxID=400775 RepID=A0ABU0ISR0_9CAUL|nr:hypothetical protein [Caulobacter ginsengisoli]MDQ0465048.1 hypothetical protein [Caulobacter ginsengisoli]
MMTASACYEKAEMCEASAAASPDEAMRASWLRMAASWRGLGGDSEGRPIIAWLLQRPHQVD